MEYRNGKCDKCGEEVPFENDATSLEFALTHDFAVAFLNARHLLPTETCEGSPSRAQYLEGQPRDTRSEYPYKEILEPIYRAAYREMMEIIPSILAERSE